MAVIAGTTDIVGNNLLSSLQCKAGIASRLYLYALVYLPYYATCEDKKRYLYLNYGWRFCTWTATGCL